jgi:hypothetical protein
MAMENKFGIPGAQKCNRSWTKVKDEADWRGKPEYGSRLPPLTFLCSHIMVYIVLLFK